MSVTITTQIVIAAGAVEPWKVHAPCLNDVDGKKFLKLLGSNCPSLLRLVVGGKPPKGLNLLHSIGLHELKTLRNVAQRDTFDEPAADFFDVSPQPRRLSQWL